MLRRYANSTATLIVWQRVLVGNRLIHVRPQNTTAPALMDRRTEQKISLKNKKIPRLLSRNRRFLRARKRLQRNQGAVSVAFRVRVQRNSLASQSPTTWIE